MIQADRADTDSPTATPADINRVAWALLNAQPPDLRDPPAALEYARRMVGLPGGRTADYLDTLALGRSS